MTRQLAVDLFNGVWTLLDRTNRTAADDETMIHMAHASRYHWSLVGTPANLARGDWLCSRVHAVLGRSEPSLHHARQVLEICAAHGIGDWDLAFGFEALARAFASGGDFDAAGGAAEQALAAVNGIAEQQNRDLVLADLATIPGSPTF